MSSMTAWVTRPPALRMTRASPSWSPKTIAGSTRWSRQVTMKSCRAGPPSAEGVYVLANWSLRSSSGVILVMVASLLFLVLPVGGGEGAGAVTFGEVAGGRGEGARGRGAWGVVGIGGRSEERPLVGTLPTILESVDAVHYAVAMTAGRSAGEITGARRRRPPGAVRDGLVAAGLELARTGGPDAV